MRAHLVSKLIAVGALGGLCGYAHAGTVCFGFSASSAQGQASCLEEAVSPERVRLTGSASPLFESSTTSSNGYWVDNATENLKTVIGVRDSSINMGEYLWLGFDNPVALQTLTTLKNKIGEHASFFLPTGDKLALGSDYTESDVGTDGSRHYQFRDGLVVGQIGISTETDPGRGNNGISLTSMTVFSLASTNAVDPVPLPGSMAAGAVLFAGMGLRRRRA